MHSAKCYVLSLLHSTLVIGQFNNSCWCHYVLCYGQLNYEWKIRQKELCIIDPIGFCFVCLSGIFGLSYLTSFKAELKTHLFSAAFHWADINALWTLINFRILALYKLIDWLIHSLICDVLILLYLCLLSRVVYINTSGEKCYQQVNGDICQKCFILSCNFFRQDIKSQKWKTFCLLLSRAFRCGRCVVKIHLPSAVNKLCIFLQFSDVLVYGSRLQPPKLQFKVHGQLALCSIDVSTYSVIFLIPVFIISLLLLNQLFADVVCRYLF